MANQHMLGLGVRDKQLETRLLLHVIMGERQKYIRILVY